MAGEWWARCMRRTRVRDVLSVVAVGALAWLPAACGTQARAPLPTLPGGTYANAHYHLSVSYPAGWQANVSPDSSSTIPLTVVLTQSDTARASTAATVSNVTIAVFNAHDPSIASTIPQMTTDTSLTHMTVAGLPGYADTPVTQQILNTTITDTHADYYVVANGYEYQISTDALSSDHSASTISHILQSLKVTK